MSEETVFNLGVGCFSIIVIAVLCFFEFFVHISPTGTGNHTGYVTAIDRVGYFLPNYIVYFKTDNASSQEDFYCVSRDNESLAQQLRDANKARQRVTVTYHGVRTVGVGVCTGEQIDKVEADE